MCFRLLTEYHSFLLDYYNKLFGGINYEMFPSPYGVSFILTLQW